MKVCVPGNSVGRVVRHTRTLKGDCDLPAVGSSHGVQLEWLEARHSDD